MSAYVVDDKTVNRILSFIEYGEAGVEGNGFLRNVLTRHHINVLDLAKLGKKMRRMNEDAVRQRYEKSTDMIPDFPFEFSLTPTPSPIQMLKSLGCYLYQCSEGNIPRRQLFRALRQAEHDLAYGIVVNLPEYDTADWG